MLTEPAGTLVYKDLSWTKEEALKYIQKTKILRFPEEVKLDKDQIKEMRLFVLGLPLTALPQTIIGRNNLITWIMGRIKATQSPKSVNRYKQLQLYMQHELFPLPEGAGLSRKDFLDAWKKRMNFAYAICYHDEVAKKSQVVQLVYEQVMRKNFKQRLSRELESKRKGLDKLRTRDVNQEFVESLRRLNLILEPTMSNTEHSTEHAH